MKRFLCLVLAVLLFAGSFSAIADSSDYTSICDPYFLNICGLTYYTKSGKTTFYSKARTAYDSLDGRETFALVCVAEDIMQQLPKTNILLESKDVAHTAYLGCADLRNLNDIVLAYYTGSKYVVADYIVSKRTLILLKQTFTEEEISALLDGLCSIYTPIDPKRIDQAYFYIDMIQNDPYK